MPQRYARVRLDSRLASRLTCPPLPDPSTLVVANVRAAHASPVETCCGPDPVDDGAIVLVRVFMCRLNRLLAKFEKHLWMR
jgi:hypothetical protein